MGRETTPPAACRDRSPHRSWRRRRTQADHQAPRRGCLATSRSNAEAAKDAKKNSISSRPSRPLRSRQALLRSIVRRLFRDGDVVHVALAEPGGRDPDKLCLALQSGKRPAAAVAHPCTQSANELMNHRRDAAFVGDTPFDALGHELFTPGRTAGTLEVELVL